MSKWFTQKCELGLKSSFQNNALCNKGNLERGLSIVYPTVVAIYYSW